MKYKRIELNLQELLPKFNLKQLTNNDKEKIQHFWKWLNQNFHYDINVKHWAPYKPYSILTIVRFLENIKNNKINEKFIEYYQNICKRDIFLQKPENKTILNKFNTLNSTKNHLFDKPFGEVKRNDRTHNELFTLNLNSFSLNISLKQEELSNFKLFIVNLCLQVLTKCCTGSDYISDLTDYDVFSGNINWEKYMVEVPFYRIHQSQWARIIKEQNKNECLICGTKISTLLEAAHIKPYSICKEEEKYSQWNGICLCSNHHVIFDRCLLVKVHNDYYEFYIKPDISEKEKKEIADLIPKFEQVINTLVNQHFEYKPFFDELCRHHSCQNL